MNDNPEIEAREKKPRGKRGQGCVYRPKGSRNYWIKFSVNGRVIQKSAESESRRDALDFLSAEKLKHASGEAVTNEKVTVDSLYDALLADYRINEKTKSVQSVAGACISSRSLAECTHSQGFGREPADRYAPIKG